MIRKACAIDAQQISRIYNYYILNTAITFETEPVDVAEMEKRIEGIVTKGYPYFVYEADGKVVGYCYLNQWKARKAYSKSAELSVYIDKDYRRQGIGKALLRHVLDNVDPDEIHTVMACITLPNESSVKIHEAFGFRKVSHYKEVGFKFGQWQDVGDWQLIFHA
ncbi:GNAT family N-acetyltransferase [Parabacteroides chinchillae]|uniref:Phosphinothricin acetyltransferase n=1 Tax=Parabacteroides chinchillae TaxID=871327 RepID=A0A8G2BXU7_9BACT|nr:GNAT family N-acetyltransferase [Parabacteroides chinchillae]SEG10373.1 phosphinothricin acetyltransferase [Parabacteroides chinchillae]